MRWCSSRARDDAALRCCAVCGRWCGEAKAAMRARAAPSATDDAGPKRCSKVIMALPQTCARVFRGYSGKRGDLHNASANHSGNIPDSPLASALAVAAPQPLSQPQPAADQPVEAMLLATLLYGAAGHPPLTFPTYATHQHRRRTAVPCPLRRPLGWSRRSSTSARTLASLPCEKRRLKLGAHDVFASSPRDGASKAVGVNVKACSRHAIPCLRGAV